jgi:hypothetical protein
VQRRALLAGLVPTLLGTPVSRARAQIGPIDLGIPYMPQQTQVWCWLACAEMIIRWKNGGSGPSQCEMASVANMAPSPMCCSPPNPMVMQACVRTGSLQEIQGLIATFGHSASSITQPGSPYDLYQTLNQRRAIIKSCGGDPRHGPRCQRTWRRRVCERST